MLLVLILLTFIDRTKTQKVFLGFFIFLMSNKKKLRQSLVCRKWKKIKKANIMIHSSGKSIFRTQSMCLVKILNNIHYHSGKCS